MLASRRHRLRQLLALLVASPFGALFAQTRPNCTGTSCTTDCGPTDASTEGPFYVANTPRVTQINLRRAPGRPMRVSGVITGGRDGATPLAGVRVEIWHADDKGDYHPAGNGDISRYRPEQINLRGVGVTDAQGRFAFDSIVPGAYGSRRRHIHWKFVAPGHRELTTQSYWLEEKGTARERNDFTDRDTEACRWLEFRPNAAGVHEAFFGVRLEQA